MAPAKRPLKAALPLTNPGGPQTYVVPRAHLLAPAPVVAQRLLGTYLVHQTPLGLVGGRIVETEAYDQNDPASHSCRGVTPRTAPMFGPPGHAYIYRSYGIHLCINVTSGPEGHGAAVLVRALEPTAGLEVMAELRGLAPLCQDASSQNAARKRLCFGPGNLTQALGLHLQQSAQDLLNESHALRLLDGAQVPPEDIVATGRIGISVAQDVPWRFFVRGSRYVSASRRA